MDIDGYFEFKYDCLTLHNSKIGEGGWYIECGIQIQEGVDKVYLYEIPECGGKPQKIGGFYFLKDALEHASKLT